MKLINPILITLNNILHIKADNLEAVEVDSSCVDELSDLVFKDTKWFIKGKTNDKYYLSRGVGISELSDRIEVRDVKINSKEPLGIGYRHFKIDVKRVFLLPVKENKCDGTCADNECICAEVRRQEWMEKMKSRSVCSIPNKSYTIEEIEKAIVDAHNNNRIYWTWDSIKKQIINNLKK